MPSQGSHRHRGISSNFEFAREQLLHAFITFEYHHKIYSFHTDLRSPATTTNFDERWRTPALRRPASGYTLAFFRSEYESPFHQVGYNSDALCLLHSPVGNALVRRVHDLVQHCGRFIKPVDGILAF